MSRIPIQHVEQRMATSQATEPALFRARPELTERVPWQPLGRFPARVERLEGLLPPEVELWVQREDACGEIYGGNKVRKLEFLLAAARARGARRLATIGRYGSHHVLATALYGMLSGFEVEAMLLPQPVSEEVLDALSTLTATGARLRTAPTYPRALPFLARQALRPGTAVIPGGGSSPAGNLGWVSGAFELAEKIYAGACPSFHRVYAPLGSAGTVAGLWLGARLADLRTSAGPTRVVGVEVARRPVVSSLGSVRFQAGAINRRYRLGADLSAPERDLHVDERFFGDGYGTPHAAAEEAIELASQAEIDLEQTYSARNFAALVDDARAGRLDGQRVLWVQTVSSVDLAPLRAAAPGPGALPAELRRLFRD